jgi:glucose-1-phosphate cytidylyltransferase
MKVVILAGGRGSRLSEETDVKPKPMVEIGERPILWHIMKIYSHFGFNEFIVCLGYKAFVIKEYFLRYPSYQNDFSIDLRTEKIKYFRSKIEPWKVTLVDTGLDTMTGGRLLRIKKYIGDETFMLTYGDGLSDVNIKKLVKFHRSHKKLATLTATQPFGRFGMLHIEEEGNVKHFKEKVRGDGGWVNAGFFVLEPQVFDYIKDDTCVLEEEPMQKISEEGQLNAYMHKGFWMCMDTLRDKNELERLWSTEKAPWRVWKD